MKGGGEGGLRESERSTETHAAHRLGTQGGGSASFARSFAARALHDGPRTPSTHRAAPEGRPH
eukprot:3742704-Alexandrium_andersonii.AAC.1